MNCEMLSCYNASAGLGFRGIRILSVLALRYTQFIDFKFPLLFIYEFSLLITSFINTVGM